MSSGDWQAFMILMGVSAVLPGMTAGALLRFRAGWSMRRTIIFAAAPVPSLIILLCVLVIGSTMAASREQCGVDACAMALAFSLIIILWALLAYCVGAVSAWMVCKGYKK